MSALPIASVEYFDWLAAPFLVKVVAALETEETASARFVGGCVRDSLLGCAPKDFDIATTLTPQRVIDALSTAGLKSAPTGIQHGTVTAIADHRSVEVTTLRADVSTDGRRAAVAFTNNWKIDAERRDFRLNAIYLTPDGQLYDPVGGVADCENRLVRFIGDARQRIEEDYLRILRFFRFTARLANQFDADGLNACVALKSGLGGLSAERIGAELMAILALPRATLAIEQMACAGILAEICPDLPDIAALDRLKSNFPEAPVSLALAALFDDRHSEVGSRLRLSNAERSLRSNALANTSAVVLLESEQDVEAIIYRLGKDGFADAARLAFAKGFISKPRATALLTTNENWTVPKFPISGKDLLARGIAAGPKVSQLLDMIERRWVAERFPSADRLHMIVDEIVASTQ